MSNPINQDRLETLRRIAGQGPVLILTHNNPDPDALASGKTIAVLLGKGWGIPSRLQYSGVVARAENRAMLEILAPEWEHVDLFPDLGEFSAVALVDTQPEAGNNNLPPGTIPQMVIDHHQPLRHTLAAVPFVDVRPEMGATGSMVYQYLEAAGLVPDQELATAIFYGIQSDTRGLSRGCSQDDEEIYIKLLFWIDRQKLVQVEQAGLPRIYFRALINGLKAARLHGKAILADLGEMHRPDLATEMADVLIRLDQADAALCLGYHLETLHLSLRTTTTNLDAGALIQKIVRGLGKAGGHGSVAGGQVLLAGQSLDRLVAEIFRRFLDAFGEHGPGEPLVTD